MLLCDFYRNSSFLGVRGFLLRNSRIPSPTASAVFYWLTTLRVYRLVQLFLLRIRWLLRSRLVALFSLKALCSPATLQKLLHSFSVACALIQRIAKQKIQRKIFAAAPAPLTASAAALKLKIAHPADAKQKNLGV